MQFLGTGKEKGLLNFVHITYFQHARHCPLSRESKSKGRMPAHRDLKVWELVMNCWKPVFTIMVRTVCAQEAVWQTRKGLEVGASLQLTLGSLAVL